MDKQNGFLESGKVPPQAVDLEAAVLGAVLLEKHAIDEVLNIISPDDFYKDSNHFIYKAAIQLYQEGSPIDTITVAQRLGKNGELDKVGGNHYINSLTSRMGSAANIVFHAKVILEQSIKRKFIAECAHAASDLYEEGVDVFDVLDKVESEAISLREKTISATHNGSLVSTLKQVVKELSDTTNHDITGVISGNPEIDSITGGFQKPDLILLAARPGMGKTARALKIAYEAWLKQGRKGVVFSLEMSKKQLLMRAVSTFSSIDNGLFKRKWQLTPMDKEKILAGASTISNFGFEIYDAPAVNVNYIRTVAKKFRRTHKQLDYIIIDYLQLMSAVGKHGNRELEVSNISASLKKLAKDFDVPVIALAQLSRALEGRSDKRPLLADLRESGSLEQDADLIMFLYRPQHYYTTLSHDPDYKNGAERTITEENYHRFCELLVSKHRNGASSLAVFESYEGKYFQFSPWGSSPIEPREDNSDLKPPF